MVRELGNPILPLCHTIPHAVGNVSIGVESEHLVGFRDVVEEGVFVVCEEGVGDPDMVGEVPREGHGLIPLLGPRQPLVPPVLVQVHCHGVILRKVGGYGYRSDADNTDKIRMIGIITVGAKNIPINFFGREISHSGVTLRKYYGFVSFVME